MDGITHTVHLICGCFTCQLEVYVAHPFYVKLYMHCTAHTYTLALAVSIPSEK